MKKTLHLLLALVSLSFSSLFLQAQDWTKNLPQDKISNPEELTFFEIQKAFNDYWEPFNVKNGYYTENGIEKKAIGWKQFKRWEWYWEYRIDPTTGKFPDKNAADIRKEIQQSSNSRNASGNWQSMGPATSPGGYGGLGRINCIGFSDSDLGRFYVGSPSGGLWATDDGGSTWTVTTDENDVLGVSDIIVNAGASRSSDVIYIATGDRDGGSMWSLGGGQFNDNNSIGVLKSTNGGASWLSTDLAFPAYIGFTVNRLLKDPFSSETIYAAVTDGVYKTTDGGATWPMIASTSEFVDMEFNPADPTIMYASTRWGEIYLSTDGGSNWSNSLYVPDAGRVELAVSESEPDWVFAVVSTDVSTLNGIYKSEDGGYTYSQIFDGTIYPNYLLGYYCDGTVDGGQGGYDLCLAADPNNADILYLGGVNTWKSYDGGNSWEISNMWTSSPSYNSCGAPEVHADKHALVFQPGTSDLFEGNDGGVYKTSDGGDTWDFLGNGLVISQIYRLGVSQTSSSDVIIGLQDNGTKSRLGGNWEDVIGGDGMECIIDYTDPDIQYGELYNAALYRTDDAWATSEWLGASYAIEGSYAAWVTPYVIDPITNTTLYIGLDEIWKTTNSGTTWTPISTFDFDPVEVFKSLAVAPSDPDVIYAATNDKIFVTTIGGTTWTDITGTLPVGSSYITYISVKDDDEQTVWVSMGEYNSYGVFESTDGGANWTDISSGLPEIPVMCVIQNKQNTSDVELYAGTDVGVYVKVGSNDWEWFYDHLPNVVVTELEIYYNDASPNLSRIRAATYGRGLWQSELYSEPNIEPTAGFEASTTTPGVGQSVYFTDLTIDDPESWLWSFGPATITFLEGTDETSQNPVVSFDAEGSYDVSLYVENNYGDDTETKYGYITAGALIYCDAEGGGDEYISGVQLNTIDNTGTGPDGYADYTYLSTDLVLLSGYNLIVTNGNPYVDDDMGAWIDWNQDGDFDDTGEEIACVVDDDGFGVYESDFEVPASALLGSTRLRIRIKYYDSDCGSPCGSTSYGEVEDYTVNVVEDNTLTWTGNTSVDWADASNWDPATVPTASFDVTIPTNPDGIYFPEISMGTAAVCNGLFIYDGANLQLFGSLTVNGYYYNGAGTSGLVVKSDASGTGSLITNANRVDVTVERYLEGGEWHLFGAPVEGQTANAIYFDHNPDVWLKTYIESSDTWSPTISDLNTALPVGMGFAVWVQTDFDATASFQERLWAFDFSVSGLAFTDASHGYNLLANPFASALDWDIGSWVRTNLDGSVWVYDPVGENYLVRNSVEVGSLTDGIIPSSQGFFVRATSSGASIEIPADARVHSSQPFYKSGNNTQNENFNFTVAAIKVSKGIKTDEAWFIFNDACTDYYDNGWDVSKFFGDVDAPQLYAVESGQSLSIDALPALEQERVVQMNFHAGDDGEQILYLKIFENFDGTELWLEDLKEETLQELTANPEYIFNAGINDAPERFLLHFNPQATGISQADESNYSIYSWNKSVYIKNPDLSANTTVEIIDMHGRTIYQGKLQAVSLNKIGILLSNSYLVVRLTDNGNVQVQKVFIR